MTEQELKMESSEMQHKRQGWSHSREFLLTCIGYAVGLSNIWRFPYLCFKNGGGAFLIPYLLAVALCGIPIACMEFCLGQYVGLGLIPFYDICPLFKGIGVLSMMVNFGLASYYIFVIALALHYLWSSFAKDVPWKSCDHSWNTVRCFDHLSSKGDDNASIPEISTHAFDIVKDNETTNYISPAEEYLTNEVLKVSGGLDHIGTVNWWLFACLIFAWLLVYLVTIKGVRSSGKAVYVTATFPYVMLTIFLCRGLTLPGSWNGLKYYLLPRWEKLLEPQVWYNAVQQVFVSLGVAWGCFMTLASYNRFDNNCYRDAILTTLINSFTSIYGGLAVFAVLGFMSHELNLSIHDVIESGPGLVFVAYPRAMATMPLAQLWSISFFLMLVILGVGSLIVHFETIVSSITDQFPQIRKTKNRMMVAGLLTLIFIGSSIIYVTNGGIYVFTLVDWYCTPFPLMIAALMECIIFPWIYGVDTIGENTRLMIGLTPSIYFRICWKYITPLFILVILCVNILTWKSVTYNEYVFPLYANIIGWTIAVIPVISILFVAVLQIWTCDKPTIKERIINLLKPTARIGKYMKQRQEDYLKTSEKLIVLPKSEETTA